MKVFFLKILKKNVFIRQVMAYPVLRAPSIVRLEIIVFQHLGFWTDIKSVLMLQMKMVSNKNYIDNIRIYISTCHNSNIRLMIELMLTAHLGQVWLRSPSDKNGWFTLQNPTIRLFLTANGNNNPTIEGNTLCCISLRSLAYL